MVSENISQGITEAKNLIDQAPTSGKIAYDLADGILTNNKAFIHDQKVWDEITAFEQKVHIEFAKKIKEAREKIKQKDPFFQWQDGMKFYLELRQWKTMEMISFWDNLSKQYDI